MPITADEIDKIMGQMGIADEDIDKIVETVQTGQGIEIPESISVESTLKEITQLSRILYTQLKRAPNNPILTTKLTGLLELKIKITGMNNLKPEMQDFIDTEINIYKRRFLEIADKHVEQTIMKDIVEELGKEGL